MLQLLRAAVLGAAFLAGNLAAAPTVFFAFGDTGDCGNGPGQVAAAIQRHPAASRGWLLELGDLAYPVATAERLRECHEPHFGALTFLRRLAVPGNHDAADPGLAGFRTIHPLPLPRAIDFGRWRVLLLDSNLRGEEFAAQQRWLMQAITAARGHCLLAAWHHPARTSGPRGDNAAVAPIFDALVGKASVTLHGHDHHYERQAPAKGTLSFIVGTGGAAPSRLATLLPGSFARAGVWGFLAFELEDEEFRWQATGFNGHVFDEGRHLCEPVQ